MKDIRPVYKKALLLAIVIYVVGVCLIMSDLYATIGKFEDAAIHAAAAPVQGYGDSAMKGGGCCK